MTARIHMNLGDRLFVPYAPEGTAVFVKHPDGHEDVIRSSYQMGEVDPGRGVDVPHRVFDLSHVAHEGDVVFVNTDPAHRYEADCALVIGRGRYGLTIR